MGLTINSSRLQEHFEVSSKIGQVAETGMYRPALSEVEKEAFGLVQTWMEEAGMIVTLDNFGNLKGHFPGQNFVVTIVLGFILKAKDQDRDQSVTKGA